MHEQYELILPWEMLVENVDLLSAKLYMYVLYMRIVCNMACEWSEDTPTNTGGA